MYVYFLQILRSKQTVVMWIENVKRFTRKKIVKTIKHKNMQSSKLTIGGSRICDRGKKKKKKCERKKKGKFFFD